MLQVKNIDVYYGRAEAIKDISLSVDQGEIVTMIGANGAGKTTTLRAISGLKRIKMGEIWFEGERIDTLPAHQIVKRGIAHIPEGRMVFGEMSVYENLQIGAHLQKDPNKTKSNLEMVFHHFPRLEERLTQEAGSLSGGEQQMLATARALMASPKLLLMDEPSMGLSPRFVEEIGNVIKTINEMGVSILLVEQNAMMALNLASRAYVLEVGSVRTEGDAKAMINDDELRKAYLGG
jgi:branched-chain amino acid transport system ATP-binding protein